MAKSLEQMRTVGFGEESLRKIEFFRSFRLHHHPMDIEREGKSESKLLSLRGFEGHGLFATDAIGSGEVVLSAHIIGPVLSRAEVRVSPYPDHFFQVDRDQYIWVLDPLVSANHSCDPNAGLTWSNEGLPIHLVAIRDIAKGEEVTFDYSTDTEEWDPVLGFECCCASEKCRRRIRNFSTLPQDLQQFYISRGMVLPFAQRLWREQHVPTEDPLVGSTSTHRASAAGTSPAGDGSA